ncbi:MAG: hypothetical protein WCG80_04465 [Spirochaetales bacterium]
MKLRLLFSALFCLAAPLFAAAQPTLTIRDENLAWGDWGTAVNEYRVYTGSEGLISKVEFTSGSGLPAQSAEVKLVGDRLQWSWNQPGLGRNDYALVRGADAWKGQVTFTSDNKASDNASVPLVVSWQRKGTLVFADQDRVASLLPGFHYVEKAVRPDTPNRWTTVYEFAGKEMTEHYRDFTNARMSFSRSGTRVDVKRLEEPDDGGWQQMGKSTLEGRSLAVANPAINAANWEILGTIVPYPIYLPFLLELGL